ncbi:hypothetical protein Q9L58_001516 [Maublancomyces gigas]|uniref:Uncharacterized protein n=1 Tax=Discina gigas TaxID=1032678 RepID=A0ABR3GU91_9PEZI
MLSFKYHGTYHLTEAMKQAFSGTAEEGKMPFGQSTMYLTFEVGSGKYKELENCTFVGNGRFIVEDGKISVESRWSVVVPSTASD